MTAGPLLAGVLGAVGGTGLALGGDAVTYALGAGGLAMLRLAAPHATDTSSVPSAAAGKESLLEQMRAGLTFLRGERTARLLVIIVAIMVAFGYLSVVAEVELAQGVLRAGPGGYAVLVASWTAGMAAGSLAGGRLPARWLVVAVLAGTVVTGAGLALAGLAPRLWLAALAYAVGGLGDGVEVLATRSYLNHRAPEEIAGRVFALYSGVMLGAASAGMAAASVLLAPLGPRLLLVIAGGGGIVAGAGGWLALRRPSGGP
jgi:MFS family permease